ncbi:MAG: phosphatase PAP2 family protein [Aeromicrobium sp.]
MSTSTWAPETRRRSTSRAVVALAGPLVALAILAFVALRTAEGQRIDERAMDAVVAGRETRLTVLSLLGYVSIGTIVAVTIGCVGLAMLRGRMRLALGAIAVIVGANVTTQVLKHGLLERAEITDVANNSLPSGHTTVVAAGVGALCLVAPRLLRPVVVFGGAFAVTLTGASTVVAGWHRPSDVLAAVLVALAWTAAVALVIGGDQESGPGVWPSALLGAAGSILLLVAIGVRPSFGWDGFVEAAVVLTVVAAVSAVGAALMDRFSPTD